MNTHVFISAITTAPLPKSSGIHLAAVAGIATGGVILLTIVVVVVGIIYKR